MMRTLVIAASIFWSQCLFAQNRAPDPEWRAERRPFRIFGNTYYVGTQGLSSILITSPSGHVLIDATLAENAPMIMDHIKTLGFRVEDIKLILNSHAHYDHAAGTAEMQRASGATVAASAWSAGVLEHGASPKDDPQFGILPDFAPVKNVRVIKDDEVLSVGPLRTTAHFTGGHTPGGTSWSWQSCEGDRCLEIVYADSQTPVSADGFLFSRSDGPDQFRRGLAVLERMRCDLLVTPHPGASGLFERVQSKTLVDSTACGRLAATARGALANRLKREGGR
jgi:metallo-beta-lactamase class B